MNCPGCQRDNRPNRRYCGACGCNLEPVCSACGFTNDRDDRFCGGCGGSMAAAGTRPVPGASPTSAAESGPAHRAVPTHHAVQAAYAPQPAAPHAARTTQAWPVDELAGLFTPQVAPPSESQELPTIGIAQDDLDRLFGADS